MSYAVFRTEQILSPWQAKLMAAITGILILAPIVISVVVLLTKGGAGTVFKISYELTLVYVKLLPLIAAMILLFWFLKRMKLRVDQEGIAFEAPQIFFFNPSFTVHWNDVEEITADPLSQKILLTLRDENQKGGQRKRRLMPALWFAVEHDLDVPQYKRMPRFKRKPLQDYPLYAVLQACKPDDLEILTVDHSNNPMATDLGDAARNLAMAAVFSVLFGVIISFVVGAVVIANGYYWWGYAGAAIVAFSFAMALMRNGLVDAKKRMGLVLTGALFAACFAYFCNALLQLHTRYWGSQETYRFELVAKLGEYSKWQDVDKRWDAVEMSSEFLEDAEIELNTKVEVPVRAGVFGIYQLRSHHLRKVLKENQQPDK